MPDHLCLTGASTNSNYNSDYSSSYDYPYVYNRGVTPDYQYDFCAGCELGQGHQI